LGKLPYQFSAIAVALGGAKHNEPKIELNEQISGVDIKGEISFRDVHSTYPSRPDAPILKGLNCAIRADRQSPLLEALEAVSFAGSVDVLQ